MTFGTESEKRSCLVIGASGLVGSHIVKQLTVAGERPYAVSRKDQPESSAEWIKADLHDPESVPWPRVEAIYCTASARLLADSLTKIATPSLRRVVLFTSTSISTKANSPDSQERAGIAVLASGERDVIVSCDLLGVKWTILRPTIIYDGYRDRNITRLAHIINRIGFFPLCGRGRGLRQPVHAEDCAMAAIKAVSSDKTENKTYNIPGGETIPYHEMVGRIFDGLKRPRLIVPIPPFLWLTIFKLAQRRFPGINAEMGVRMAKDLVFDSSPAVSDFGWNPRRFTPSFKLEQTSS